MLCRSVLVAAGMAALCLVMGLPQPHRQEPVCPSQHSCSSRSTSEAYSRLECSCDASCRTHGDCCRDSQYYDEAEQMKGASEYVCADLDPCWGLTRYMKYKCPEGWDNTEVQELCLKGIQSGHFNLFPVTSTTTSTTYVNQYCALCNGEDTASLRMWNAQIECLNVPISHISKDYSVGFHEGQWVFGIFSMLFDVVDRCGSKSVGFTCCSPEEIWDSSSEKCRKVFCPNPNENSKAVNREGQVGPQTGQSVPRSRDESHQVEHTCWDKPFTSTPGIRSTAFMKSIRGDCLGVLLCEAEPTRPL
ncbi:hypothetical protein O3P69_015913 [Scylla paramamosain]|uniref:SMB domain-containing protein n=1 Tax=Scylla paramamosain TaxID=85552 RepID=A0AAW0T867_SCYPA